MRNTCLSFTSEITPEIFRSIAKMRFTAKNTNKASKVIKVLKIIIFVNIENNTHKYVILEVRFRKLRDVTFDDHMLNI